LATIKLSITALCFFLNTRLTAEQQILEPSLCVRWFRPKHLQPPMSVVITMTERNAKITECHRYTDVCMGQNHQRVMTRARRDVRLRGLNRCRVMSRPDLGALLLYLPPVGYTTHFAARRWSLVTPPCCGDQHWRNY